MSGPRYPSLYQVNTRVRLTELSQTLGRPATLRDGQWPLLECRPAWDGNWTWDAFIAFAWQGPESRLLLGVVNYAGNQGQCYVRLPFEDLLGQSVRLQDRTSSAVYDRNGDTLLAPGLYLDMPPWGYQVFDVCGTA